LAQRAEKKSTGPAPPGARAWAGLIARIHGVDPLRCSRCGASLQLIAFIVEREVIDRILQHVGEPTDRRCAFRTGAHGCTRGAGSRQWSRLPPPR